jgi:hypothetical protein
MCLFTLYKQDTNLKDFDKLKINSTSQSFLQIVLLLFFTINATATTVSSTTTHNTTVTKLQLILIQLVKLTLLFVLVSLLSLRVNFMN